MTGSSSNIRNTSKSDAVFVALSKSRLEGGRDHVDKMFASVGGTESSITDQSSTFPSFTLEQLTLGKVLGKGGFGTVSEVRAFSVDITAAAAAAAAAAEPTRESCDDDDDEYENKANQMESRLFIAKHCLRSSSSAGKNGGGSSSSSSGKGGSGDARYAIKELSPETKKDATLFLQGLIDMAVETRFLSDLEHPNIVKMRAICQTSDGSPFSDPQRYFIVMDRLYDTLEKRLLTWKKQSDRLKSGAMRFMTDRKGTKGASLYEDRIMAAYDLSAALEYLHSRQIAYRDLKPENIGFDIRNDVKIFDFGLSKELRMAKEKYDDGTYKLTEMTGSPRYMAPEVGLGKPYNAKCDTYSFAVLLWEIITLRTPYELMGLSKLKTRVWQEGGEEKRPYIPDSDKHKDASLWTASMKLLLKRSWCADIQARNSMEQVSTILRKECVRARDGDESGLEHNRRRSTFVFRPSTSNNNKKAKGRTGLLERMTLSKKKMNNDIPAPGEPPEFARSAPAAISSSPPADKPMDCYRPAAPAPRKKSITIRDDAPPVADPVVTIKAATTTTTISKKAVAHTAAAPHYDYKYNDDDDDDVSV